MPGRLQDRCGDERNAHEHRRDAKQKQQRGAGRVAARIEHIHDRVRQHGEADAHRHGDRRRNAQCRLRNGVPLIILFLHDHGRNGRELIDGACLIVPSQVKDDPQKKQVYEAADKLHGPLHSGF